MLRNSVVLMVLCLLGSCSMERVSVSDESNALLTGSRPSPDVVRASHEVLKKISERPITGVELVQTDTGKTMLSMLVSCALTNDASLLVPLGDGTSIEFLGEAGLAANWQQRSLTRDEKYWVSGCVLVHLSVTAVFSVVSMRGPNSALASTKAERGAFDIEEGGFFGNIFTPASEDIDWRACSGTGQLQNPFPGALNDRTCAEQDPDHPTLTLCGFEFVGSCSDACERSSLFYTHCTSRDTTFHQVITTFVVE